MKTMYGNIDERELDYAFSRIRRICNTADETTRAELPILIKGIALGYESAYNAAIPQQQTTHRAGA